MTLPLARTDPDPRRIRALAHPLRLELLELLTEGDLTATECAARTGASVASCAFHLKSLGKYDFVRPGERRGREKPWHLVARGHDVRPDVDDPASLRATQEMATLAVDREMARIKDWIDRIGRESAEWIDTSTITSSRFWATAEELAAVSTQLRAPGRAPRRPRDRPGVAPVGLPAGPPVRLRRARPRA